MMLPNFLIIGAQKSGTTWIAKNLADHPDIFVHYYPEINFFNLHFEKGLEWYKSFFPYNKPVIAEKSPGYLFSENIHERIKQTLPNVKLIISLRDPVQRAISAINHYRRTGHLILVKGINKFINELINGEHIEFEKKYGVLKRGKYINGLRPLFETFSDEQILVLAYEEDIKNNSSAGMKKICQFLSIPFLFDINKIKKPVNKNPLSKTTLYLRRYSPFSQKINDRILQVLPIYPLTEKIEYKTLLNLNEYYRADNEVLFEFLGKRITAWG